MKEPLISYDWKHELWHLMVNYDYDTINCIASCHANLKTSEFLKHHIDWNYKERSLAFGIPYPHTLLGQVNREDIKFGFDYICKKCLKLEKVNIEEFKVWLVIQKLKYL